MKEPPRNLAASVHQRLKNAAAESGGRFNDLFRRRYRLSPSDLRRTPHAGTAASTLEFHLSYRPPYAWDAILAFLADRTIAGVESVADGVYRRVVAVRTGPRVARGWLAVRHRPARHALGRRRTHARP